MNVYKYLQENVETIKAKDLAKKCILFVRAIFKSSDYLSEDKRNEALLNFYSFLKDINKLNLDELVKEISISTKGKINEDEVRKFYEAIVKVYESSRDESVERFLSGESDDIKGINAFAKSRYNISLVDEEEFKRIVEFAKSGFKTLLVYISLILLSIFGVVAYETVRTKKSFLELMIHFFKDVFSTTNELKPILVLALIVFMGCAASQYIIMNSRIEIIVKKREDMLILIDFSKKLMGIMKVDNS